MEIESINESTTEKEVVKIQLQYDDGTTEELEKCAAFSFGEDEDGSKHVHADMVGISGQDLVLVCEGVAMVAEKLGLFDEYREIEDAKLRATH